MNISEFAKEAGVSVSAVSRYFNNGYLAEDKKEKIEAALKRTGYMPSYSARAVRSKVTKLIGVILPKLSSESISRVTEGISEVLGEEGFELLLVNTANDYNREISSLELFRQNRVDGVILLASVFTDLHRSLLAKMRVPVVIIGQQLKGYNCVCHNDFGAAYSMTKLMLSKGVKRPALIGANHDDKAAGEDRRKGFEKAVEEAGAFCVVIEGVPSQVAVKITEQLSIPTIGIGASSACDGQVLVYQDMLGMFSDFTPKFVKKYANIGDIMKEAFVKFKEEVSAGVFPAKENEY